MKNKKLQKDYKNILKSIVNIAFNAQQNALKYINIELLKRNWLLGREINNAISIHNKTNYGKHLIKKLSNDLSKLGKGFKEQRLYEYLKFYRMYKNIFQSVTGKSYLTWTHYCCLIQINDRKQRNWYESQAFNCCWSVRVLERNIKTDMYHRVISNQLSGNSKQLVNIENNNYLKSLMILEFLGLKKGDQYKESDLQKSLETNMSKFLLELGKGYAFVGKQVHLKTNNNDYYIDLVFYNTILKRYLLIDLKVGEIKHKDIGQMLFYLRLFDKQNNIDEENKSIGMILSSDLNSDIVKYLMDKTKDNVLASKYLTYLPTKEEIRKELERIFQ